MAKRLTNRNTKAEILAAYDALVQEKKQVETQLKQARRSPVPELSPEPSPASDPAPAVAPTASVIGESETPITQLKQVRFQFGGFVHQLSQALSQEASQFAEVSGAIQAEQQRLRELYEIESIDETTLRQLVDTYLQESKQFADEFAQEQERLQNELEQQQRDWLKEQEEWQRCWDEEQQHFEKTWQREEQDYTYQQTQQQQQEEDEYQQQQQQQYRRLGEMREEQEQVWQDQEAALAAREAEFADLSQKVEQFPHQRDEQIETGKRQGEAIANHQVKAALDLRQQEIEGQKQRYDLRIEGLERTIGDRQQQLQTLSLQLQATLEQVQELAVKAIEGNANRDSIEAVKEIALEQAKTMGRNR
ncbi:hypothetical protein E1H12_10375 [Geitlerinema sp. P-1104]|uniref:hypothetical protein n=1 Tax=Geitlerinema sp. P-1104 TaxID=2546230 RepID=UPI0014768FCA|nr:hypothetical protein [Geitlerinema sp. P-1104]NMG58910.1 hypothetical protein [Geitlerinema sp. P-1104]